MYIVMNNTVAFRSTFAEMTYFVVCKIRLISLCVKFGLLYQLFHNVAREPHNCWLYIEIQTKV